MKVQTPPLTESEVTQYGPIVSGTCPKDIKTYRLVPKTAEELKSEYWEFILDRMNSFIFLLKYYSDRRRRSPDSLTFMYSVGKRAIMVDIDH